jgi:hypothetical protein
MIDDELNFDDSDSLGSIEEELFDEDGQIDEDLLEIIKSTDVEEVDISGLDSDEFEDKEEENEEDFETL